MVSLVLSVGPVVQDSIGEIETCRRLGKRWLAWTRKTFVEELVVERLSVTIGTVVPR